MDGVGRDRPRTRSRRTRVRSPSMLQADAPPAVTASRSRLVSVDVLRGLAVALMVLVNVPGDHGVHPSQLVHVDWEGFRLAESVFPAFVVASGSSLALSTRSASLTSTFARAGRIFVVGLLLVWWKYGELGLRTGTLQFVAGSWLVAALLYRLPARWRVAAAVLLLAAVAAVHSVPSLPGRVGWGVDGIDAQVDAPLFAGRSDVGLLGMLSAGSVGLIAAVVVGAVRGSPARRRAMVFAGAAAVAFALSALLVAVGLPVVKRTWSPSYLAVGAALCFVVLATSELVAATVARRLLEPIVALGTNALPLYVLSSAVAIVWTSASRRSTTAWLHRMGLPEGVASLSVSCLVLAVVLSVAWWLRRSGRVIRL